MILVIFFRSVWVGLLGRDRQENKHRIRNTFVQSLFGKESRSGCWKMLAQPKGQAVHVDFRLAIYEPSYIPSHLNHLLD